MLTDFFSFSQMRGAMRDKTIRAYNSSSMTIVLDDGLIIQPRLEPGSNRFAGGYGTFELWPWANGARSFTGIKPEESKIISVTTEYESLGLGLWMSSIYILARSSVTNAREKTALYGHTSVEIPNSDEFARKFSFVSWEQLAEQAREDINE